MATVNCTFGGYKEWNSGWRSSFVQTNDYGIPGYGLVNYNGTNTYRAIVIKFTTPTFPANCTNKTITVNIPLGRATASGTYTSGEDGFHYRVYASAPDSSIPKTYLTGSTPYVTVNYQKLTTGNYATKSFTTSAADFQSNTTYYMWIYSESPTGNVIGYFGHHSNTGYISVSTSYTENSSSSTVYYAYVIYNANNGSNAPSMSEFSAFSTSITGTLSTQEPIRDGYTFLGWSKSSTATSATYSAGGSIPLTGSTTGTTTTLYAVWQQNSSSSTWSSYSDYNSTYTSSTNFNFSLSAGQVGYCTFKAPSDGTLRVYATGDFDTYGSLTAVGATLSGSASYAPNLFSSTYASNDDDGDGSNFSFSYDVNSGTSYKINFSNYYPNKDASGILYIDFTPKQSGWHWSSKYGETYNSSISFDFELDAGEIGCVFFYAYTNGTLQVYTTGSSDTYGWLVDPKTVSINSSTGSGSNVISSATVYAQSDDVGSNRNFSFSFDVTEKTNYEIDWHNYSVSNSASGTLHIVFTPTVYYTITCKDIIVNSTGVQLGINTVGSVDYAAGSTARGSDWEMSSYTGYYNNDEYTTIQSVSSTDIVYRYFRPHSYDVLYDVNGGSGSIPSTYRYYNETYKLTELIPTRQRHTFIGWGTSEDATSGYTHESIIPASTSTDDITYYAIWERDGNVYIGINNEWILCETYVGVNGEWVPMQMKVGANNNWN